MTNIVVFASGTGTNFQAIIDAIEKGKITDAKISGLIASKSGIEAIDRANNYDIPVRILDKSQLNDENTFTEKLLQTLDEFQADLLVLAGYLHKIPVPVINEYRNCIINIHPSLLPAYGGKGYYGSNVHKAVIENEESVTGCTVHYVTQEYDEGPIIDQRTIKVRNDDTVESLAERVSREEHQLLPAVIQELIHNDN